MYSPFIGRFAERDPEDYAAGDLNLHRYVTDNPIDSTDPTGRWLSGDHTALTRESFLRAFSDGLDGMSAEGQCSQHVLAKLTAANVNQDSGSATGVVGGIFGIPPNPNSPSEQFERHFVRRPSEDREIAIHRYKDYIGTEVTAFQRDVQLAQTTSNCVYCDMALSALGRVTHSWQDFYAHAVGPNGTGNIFSQDGGASPDQSARGLWPPTYPGEHPRLAEPAMSAGERATRLELAAEFVASAYAVYLGDWYSACNCCCPSPLPAQPPLVPPRVVV
jgi:hypothetical protein